MSVHNTVVVASDRFLFQHLQRACLYTERMGFNSVWQAWPEQLVRVCEVGHYHCMKIQLYGCVKKMSEICNIVFDWLREICLTCFLNVSFESRVILRYLSSVATCNLSQHTVHIWMLCAWWSFCKEHASCFVCFSHLDGGKSCDAI